MNFKIFDGRGSFYQWDLNQKLIIEGASLNDKIHFKNIDGVNALVVKPYSSGGNIVVDVPNVLLQKANSITVWVYVNDDHTKEQAVFNVIPRQKPADYIYTPTEVSVWKVLEEAVENLPNEYARINHVHSQYLTEDSVGEWAKKGSEYEITGNPVTLENLEYMPMDVITTLEPIQAGSGDPAPDNIRPISGWMSAKLTRCGKNLLSKAAAGTQTNNGITFTSNGDGSYTINGTSTGGTAMQFATEVPITIPVGAYLHLGNTGALNNNVAFVPHFTDGTTTSLAFTVENRVWKISDDHIGKTIKAIGIYVNGVQTADVTFKPMMCIDGTPGEFEPYQGINLTADFGQTVYGGTLDWQTGVLTVDTAFRTFDGTEDWKMTASAAWTGERGKGFYFGIGGENTGDVSIAPVCNMFKGFPRYPESAFTEDSTCISAAGYEISIMKTAYSSIDDWKAFLAAQYAAGTPVQIAYKLASPTTIQLTPNEIEALQGVNTLYGDGSLTVSGSKDVYWLSKNLVERIKTLESAIISLGGNV